MFLFNCLVLLNAANQRQILNILKVQRSAQFLQYSGMVKTLPFKLVADSNACVNYSSQSVIVEFEAFYDKYAAALYGEIKRRLRNDEVSQQVMIEACTKISRSFKNSEQGPGKPFISALRVVNKEISKTKVNIALNQILFTQLQKRQRVSI